jgi:hypothetical protein
VKYRSYFDLTFLLEFFFFQYIISVTEFTDTMKCDVYGVISFAM